MAKRLLDTAVPLAKLSRPRLPTAAPRKRLFARLEALRNLPCTWVCGPAGSGKTTVVSDYLRASGEPSFWFHVDEGDRDASALIAYLVTIAAGIDPTAPPLPYLTPEHQADTATFCRQFFRRFYQTVPAASTMVFDNCHRAAGTSFHAVLRCAIEEAPEGIRLIALSRHQLPEDLIAFQANRQADLIGADDLRLDLAETRAVVDSLRAPASVDCEALHALTDGWAAGIVLMLSRSGSSAADRAAPRMDRASRDAVFAYFADELFRTLDAPLRALLLRTALLPTVTAAQANALTTDDHADELLEGLYRRHFFTARREPEAAGQPASYCYHDLFRAFLLERLERELAPDELRLLRGRVAAILEQDGLVADAIEQHRALGNWEAVARLIRQDAQRLTDQGQLQTLRAWLDDLPAARVAADPWLLLFDGHATATVNPTEATRIFEAAYDRFVELSDEAGQSNAAFALMETMMMSSATYTGWDRWIDVLARLLASNPPESPDAMVRAWHTLLYTCLYRRPNHPLIPAAAAILDRELSNGRLGPTQAVQAGTGLLAYAHFRCDEALAARVVPILHRWLAGEQLAVMSRALATGWILVYTFFDARYEEALEWAGKSIAVAQSHGFKTIARAWSWYGVQALAHLGRGEAALAEATRLQAAATDPTYSSPAAYAACSAALAHFVAGDTAAAIRLGERGLEAWRENGFIMARLAWAQSMQAVFRMAAGDTEAALDLVAEAEAGLAGTVCNYPDALYAALRAHAALARGATSEAAELMSACLALASNHKRIAVLSWARPFLPRLFSFAWKMGIERTRVARLVTEWGIQPATADEPDWPHPLEIYVLGPFAVRRFGSPIEFRRKPPRKVLALLKIIAIHGEHGISVENARHLLWPDLDGDAATMSQSAALYRLRRMLGLPDAIRSTEGRLTLDPTYAWVDLAAFERLAASEREPDRLRAMAVYRGPLLPHDEDDAWTTAARLRLRDTFARLVEQVAAPLEHTDPEAAERLYLRGIEAEPLAEACYRGLMRCHAGRGRAADVAAVYRRLRQTLSVLLGIEPSAESERLRKRILEGA